MADKLAAQVAVLQEVVKQHELRVIDAFHSRDLAVAKAEDSVNYRLEGMNEFRSQLADQQRTFITKDEYILKHDPLVEKIDILTEHVTPILNGDILGRLGRNTDGLLGLQTAKTTTLQSWMAVAGIISTLASLGTVIAVLLSFKH